MAHACVATVTPLHISTGERIAIRACSANRRSVTGIGGLQWAPAIISAPVTGLTLWNGDFSAAVSAGGLDLQMNMGVVKEYYPDADACYWIGARLELHAGAIDSAWPWNQVFAGTVAGFARKAQVLTLNVRVDEEPFAANVLSATYAGTTGAEGEAGLKGRVKPLLIGYTLNAEPVLIDADNSVYQFSGYGPIEEVVTLFERGSAFSASIGDYADYDALVAATIAPGLWGTCLAEGMVRLGAPAYGVITGDVKGHALSATGDTPRLTGAIISALAGLAGVDTALIDTDSLAALDAAAPHDVNLYLTGQATFFEQARALAIACNAQAGIGMTGQFFVARVPDLETAQPDITLDARGRRVPQVKQSDELDVSAPYRKIIMGANRAWRVHNSDEISFTAELVDRGEYDAAETYREGNMVDQPNGSRWLYISTTPTAGNDPPAWPTTSNAWWSNINPPLKATGITFDDDQTVEDLKPAEAAATVGAVTASNLRRDDGVTVIAEEDILNEAVSFDVTVPAGFTIADSTISNGDTFVLGFDTGYSLPLTADTAKGVTAFGWGDHASAGYFSAAGGTLTGGLVLVAGTTTVKPWQFQSGTLNTTPAAGVMEYDGAGFYATIGTVEGRGFAGVSQFYKMPADRSGIAASIEDYFAADSSPNLKAGGTYLVEFVLDFTKTTAGTVTFTLTNTQAPVNLNAEWEGIMSIGAAATKTGAGIRNSTSAGAALPATGSISNGASAKVRITAMLDHHAGNDGNLRLQVTCSAGTLIARKGSWMRVTRIPANSIGNFAT